MSSEARKSLRPSKSPNQASTATPTRSSSSSLSFHLAMDELKQRILTSLSKLSDRDTHQIAVEDLEKIIQTLSSDGVSMLLNCLYDATNDPKPAVKKESLRLLAALCATHGDSTATHLTKVIGHIVKRLKDSDSGMRDSCRDAIGALSSQYLKGEVDNGGLGLVVSLFVKPLFEAMNEQNKGVQAGSAMCMAKMVECASDPPIVAFQKLCPRICKLLNNPNFLAKAALLPVVSSLSQYDCSSDWNGSKRGHVYKFLKSQGFVSSYDTAHQYTNGDAQKWVSHRNHRGNIYGVDFIWLLNPNRYRKLLKTSWSETVFGMFKSLLQRASLTENDAFAFLKADSHGDYITYSGFCEALRQLNLIGHHHGLSVEETKDLWVQADFDGNGVLDYKEFQQRIWNPTWSEQIDETSNGVQEDVQNCTEQTVGFSVKNAVLFPTEVEKGMWPEDYSLSDHARLTVVFSPVRMPCTRLIS